MITAESRTETAKRVRAIFHDRFPRAFAAYRTPKWPLKIGITGDLVARCPDLTRKDIKIAVIDYVRSGRYHQAMIEGTFRVDLDGNPTTKVTADEARHHRESMSSNDLRSPIVRTSEAAVA